MKPSEESVAKAVGQRVRAARRGKHLTQSQLAELIGASQATVARVERGQLPVTWDRVQVIADALGADAKRLLMGGGR